MHYTLIKELEKKADREREESVHRAQEEANQRRIERAAINMAAALEDAFGGTLVAVSLPDPVRTFHGRFYARCGLRERAHCVDLYVDCNRDGYPAITFSSSLTVMPAIEGDDWVRFSHWCRGGMERCANHTFDGAIECVASKVTAAAVVDDDPPTHVKLTMRERQLIAAELRFADGPNRKILRGLSEKLDPLNQGALTHWLGRGGRGVEVDGGNDDRG